MSDIQNSKSTSVEAPSPSPSLGQLQEHIEQLSRENNKLEKRQQELHKYIREKTDQLLTVMGTLPLKQEELDDETLISVDPIGIVGDSFAQVIEHLNETNENLSFAMEELQAILDSAGASILVVNSNKQLTSFNRSSRELFFPEVKDPLLLRCCEVVCQSNISPAGCILERVLATGETQKSSEFHVLDRYYHVIGTPIKNKDNIISHIVLVYSDITERKNNEEALRESEERYRTLYSTMQEGVAQYRMIYDVDGNAIDYEIININPAYESIIGLKRQQVIGHMASTTYPQKDGKAACLDIFDQVVSSGVSANFEFSFKDMTLNVSAAKISEGHFATIFEDITQRKADEKHIEKLAYYDILTGLPNRVLMQDRLSQMTAFAKRNDRKIGVFFLDIDHFKRINDTFGHDTGDQMLIVVAERLRGVLRDCDTVSRIGGDEFVILVDNITTRDNASVLACKILEAMTPSIVLKGKEVYSSTSIGIGIFPEDGADSDSLLKNADVAMYQAKESGRNTYRFYSSEMNSKALQQLLLANDLRKALDKNEFYLDYQPQIDLREGRMTGMEALLRWQHDSLGKIPPDQFIPLAEETGLILSIGRWVMEKACQQTRKIQLQCNIPLRVAVNLSTKQFQDPNLLSYIKEILDSTGLAAEDLELEITESILMENVEKAQQILRQLKTMGVTLAIDDFGTGYSSLSYLRTFPIDRLKIDKSFIQRITTHPDDAAITKAIIVMGHTMGIKIVAEGVEQKDEKTYLQDNSCDEVQGFYFSYPLKPETLIDFIFNQPEFCFFNSQS